MIEKRETLLGAGLKWFIIMTLGGMLLLFTVKEDYYEILSDIYFLVAALVIGYVVLRSWENSKLIKGRKVNFHTIADEHGYVVDSDKPKLTKIFRLSEQRDPRFINTMSGRGWRYGDFTYNIYRRLKGSNYRAVEVYYSILELDLPRRLPNMFFDSPNAHGLQFLPYLDESQRTSLEGDFDKYFTIYFPMHYHIDARSIISPDVMTAMIDSGVSDIEISGDKLYLYSPLMPVHRIPEFIREGQEICKKLSDHIVFYRDERLGDQFDRKDVSIFGKSLRKRPRFPWLMFVACTVLLISIGAIAAIEGNYMFFAVISAAYIIGVFVEAKTNWWNVRRSNKALDRRYQDRAAAKKRKSKTT